MNRQCKPLLAAAIGLLPALAHARGIGGNAAVIGVVFLLVLLPALLSAVKGWVLAASSLALVLGGTCLLVLDDEVNLLLPIAMLALGAGLGIACFLFGKRLPAWLRLPRRK